MKMNININLDLECLLKLCDKDPKFQVAIQKSALNYLRNNRLKPLMKVEIVQEIELFKKDIQSHVKETLKTLGIKPDSWNSSYVLLDDKSRDLITNQVLLEMNKIISETVHKQLVTVYNTMKFKIKEWENTITSLCEKSITEATIKRIATEVIEKKFK